MATKEVKSGDLLRLDPRKLQINQAINSRFAADSKEETKEFAEQLLEMGQLQPIGVAPLDSGKYEVVYGYRRAKAARYIVENGLDPDFKITAILQDQLVDDQKAFAANFAENKRRKDLTIMDIAVACKRATDPVEKGGFGFSQIAAGKYLGYSDASVRQYLKLLSLPPDVQKRIHKGEINFESGVSLAEQPEKASKALKKAEAAAKDSTKEGEPLKITTANIKKAFKELGAEDGAAGEGGATATANGEAPEKPKGVVSGARRPSEIKEDFATLDGPGSSNAVINIARAFRMYADGEMEFPDFVKILERNAAEDSTLNTKLKPKYIREEEEAKAKEAEKAKEKAEKEKEKEKEKKERAKAKEAEAKATEKAKKEAADLEAKAKALKDAARKKLEAARAKKAPKPAATATA